jgi:hypothetical protein
VKGFLEYDDVFIQVFVVFLTAKLENLMKYKEIVTNDSTIKSWPSMPEIQ